MRTAPRCSLLSVCKKKKRLACDFSYLPVVVVVSSFVRESGKLADAVKQRCTQIHAEEEVKSFLAAHTNPVKSPAVVLSHQELWVQDTVEQDAEIR